MKTYKLHIGVNWSLDSRERMEQGVRYARERFQVRPMGEMYTPRDCAPGVYGQDFYLDVSAEGEARSLLSELGGQCRVHAAIYRPSSRARSGWVHVASVHGDDLVAMVGG